MSVETLAVEAREQLRTVLNGCEMHEAAALRWALLEGRIEGRKLWSNELGCGCVLGTLAHERDAEHPGLAAVERWRARDVIAIEAFAYPIRMGDGADLESDWQEHEQDGALPACGPARAAELVRWIDEWMSERSVSNA